MGAYFIGLFPDNLSYTRNQRSSIKRNLTMGGGDIRTVQTLLGHKDLRMTMRYSHLSPEHLRDAVLILDKGIGNIVYANNLQTGDTVSSQR